MLNLIHSPYTIYALSIHHLCTIYAWTMKFYDKDINYLRGLEGFFSEKGGENGKKGRRRKKCFNWAGFGKKGSRALKSLRRRFIFV